MVGVQSHRRRQPRRRATRTGGAGVPRALPRRAKNSDAGKAPYTWAALLARNVDQGRQAQSSAPPKAADQRGRAPGPARCTCSGSRSRTTLKAVAEAGELPPCAGRARRRRAHQLELTAASTSPLSATWYRPLQPASGSRRGSSIVEPRLARSTILRVADRQLSAGVMTFGVGPLQQRHSSRRSPGWVPMQARKAWHHRLCSPSSAGLTHQASASRCWSRPTAPEHDGFALADTSAAVAAATPAPVRGRR